MSGTNAQGCAGTASVMLATLANPTVTATGGNNSICVGETATLTGSGATTYQWVSSSSFLQANPAFVSPNASTTYTVIGTDNFGCSSSVQVNLTVDACAGINQYSNNGVSVYPNPVNSQLNIVAGSVISNVTVTDMTGRIILEKSTDTSVVDMSNLANGVYYIKVATANNIEIIKVVKQ